LQDAIAASGGVGVLLDVALDSPQASVAAEPLPVPLPQASAVASAATAAATAAAPAPSLEDSLVAMADASSNGDSGAQGPDAASRAATTERSVGSDLIDVGQSRPVFSVALQKPATADGRLIDFGDGGGGGLPRDGAGPPSPPLPIPVQSDDSLSRMPPQRASDLAAADASGTLLSPAPERDQTPRPVVTLPRVMRRTRVIIIRELIEDHRLPAMVPHMLQFADEASLRACMLVNKVFMAAAASLLYQSISLFGSCGPVLRKLVRLMAASADGQTMTDYRAAVRSLEIGDLVLDEPEVTPLQSWNLARELIRRLSPNLEHLYLDSDDPRFRDPDFIQTGTCGLDQRVTFPRLRSLAIAPGCLAFPDEFVYDILRRCPKGSLASIRLPGCIRNMSGTGYFLISERGGASLTDLIITPPNSFPPPATVVYGDFDPEQLIANANDAAAADAAGLEGHAGRRLAFRNRGHSVGGGDDDDDDDPLAPYDPMAAWDPDLLADGLQLLGSTCPNLRALDISGHTTGLRPGALESLLRGCEDMEELDLPCGVTDATLYELLMVRPGRLWRLNLACSCHRCYTDPVTAETAARAVPCSFITDGVVRGVLDEVLAGKAGAMIELPTHVMEVRTARMLPTLAVLEEIPGAKVDMNDTDGVYVARIAVRAVVPNGRLLMP
ncbi:hypothetical protein HK405_012338, partial [Cladochytrium tenue]